MRSDRSDETNRLLIVSNRLPFTAAEEGGHLHFKGSVGGVASGLGSYLNGAQNTPYVWIGWPGTTIESDEARDELRQEAIDLHNCYPVFLGEDEMENFYHGFCNKIIWPLFHYFPSYAIYKPEYWEHYKRVNEAFCEAVLEVARPGDDIWIHDYHLMLLPALLRERLPEARIGFFLHIPFPAYEVFRLIPREWGKGILRGLLGADLIGFHTGSYTRYFLRSVSSALGFDYQGDMVQLPDRVVQADSFPMGIDYYAFHKIDNAARGIENRVPGEAGGAPEQTSSEKVVLSIDRLDYTKAVPQRLEAFEAFLGKHPEWHDKVRLSLVLVPSRIAVEHYQQTKRRIDELVGMINGRFGNLSWTPVMYRYRSLPFDELVELYRRCDVALVTPLRDGMNLIAKEYVASKVDRTGVLVLSEFAGSSDELREAIIVNPNNRDEVVSALKTALEMRPDEQQARMTRMQTRLMQNDVFFWGANFLQTLNTAALRRYRANIDPQNSGVALGGTQAVRRRLLLNTKGVLVRLPNEPDQPSEPATGEGADKAGVDTGGTAENNNRSADAHLARE